MVGSKDVLQNCSIFLGGNSKGGHVVHHFIAFVDSVANDVGDDPEHVGLGQHLVAPSIKEHDSGQQVLDSLELHSNYGRQ